MIRVVTFVCLGAVVALVGQAVVETVTKIGEDSLANSRKAIAQTPLTFNARAVATEDGYTLRIAGSDARPVTLRLIGVHPPDAQKPFAVRAKQSLADIVLQHDIRASCPAFELSVGLLCHVYVGSRDVGAEQVRRGMLQADANTQPGKQLLDDERAARNEKRGLWAEPPAGKHNQERS